MCSVNTLGLFYTCSVNTHEDNNISKVVQRTQLEIFERIQGTCVQYSSVFREHVYNSLSVFRENEENGPSVFREQVCYCSIFWKKNMGYKIQQPESLYTRKKLSVFQACSVKHL